MHGIGKFHSHPLLLNSAYVRAQPELGWEQWKSLLSIDMVLCHMVD
jgi:hypothetical protein